ncbi:2-amino-4-hydroxy-6-hydroxymethyldihydropteridine diphosphokinase [Stieleria sp. JC731]|uniref:2-amino-4-hydroxy-6- hydroxymethyldihydropteridine diphosphokinase n=1 Tax=Pirellulaceae TaxID=2691357 RepID=UPI001E5EF1DF|nr:2-amino-4-hydroxy-6-hydroxymethyldihydropteridine diphosphokinase [Stieleria sp. JC731]MCC9600114.1 2-amino-4-hydroxy-6-hydroxymethyldihydropteridine diphosphokinase [Stieleria sp. JC731]
MKPTSPPISRPLPGASTPQHVQQSQCLISFGSNLGDRHDLIAAAASEIAGWDIVSTENPLQTSRLFETPPIGGPSGQEPFLNAVGAFETTAPAREVLGRLQELENRLGRQRRRRWDARSIDLDVVLHGQLVGGATNLVVPHPRYTARQFVLKPACDVVPHFRDPRFGWTMRQLHDHLLVGSPSLALVTGSRAMREAMCERLEAEHGIAYRREGAAEFETGELWESKPWVSSEWTRRPQTGRESSLTSEGVKSMPRLLVRLHRVEENLRWPAPHLMWPGGWGWPEYRLECSDIDWAIGELASAFDSMRCEVLPVSEDGRWWKK